MISFWFSTVLCNAATELFIVWAVASSPHCINCQRMMMMMMMIIIIIIYLVFMMQELA
jgi:hypothetical protein